MSAKLYQQTTGRSLLQMLLRRRTILLWTSLVVFVVAVLALMTRPKTYDATATIQFQKEGPGALNLNSLLGAPSSADSDALEANVELQTQSSILQSSTLALKVIEALHLQDTPDFKSAAQSATRQSSAPHGEATAQGPGAQDPAQRQRLLAIFKKNLHVSVVAGTRLIQVTYTSKQPELAANVANSLVRSLVEYSFTTRYQATNDVSKWLEQQLGDLRKRNEDLQTRVVALQKRTGLYGIGGVDAQGRALLYSPAIDQLQQSTSALAQAEENAILKGSIYRAAATGNAELISQLSGTASGLNAGPGVTSTLSLIQTLRAQEATLSAQVSQDAAIFGSSYPKLIEERAALARVQQTLNDEVSRVQARSKTDYEIAQRDLEGARKIYADNQTQASKINDRTIEYSIVRREAEQSQTLYQDLFQRLQEAGVLQGMQTSSISVVDEARPPATPSHPSGPAFLLGGLVFALLGGVGATVILDALDPSVQSPDEIRAADLPLLAVLPTREKAVPGRSEGNGEITVVGQPRSGYSEGIRQLRSAVLATNRSTPPKVLLITSGGFHEGRTSTALELASSLAQMGKRTLLIEADMRSPTLHSVLHLTDEATTLQGSLEKPISKLAATAVPELRCLFVLPASKGTTLPAEMLASNAMAALISQARSEFDFVVLDSPPLLAVADAEVLSGLADLTLLLVRPGKTSRTVLQRATEVLDRDMEDGNRWEYRVVVNGLRPGVSGYNGYLGYSRKRQLEYAKENA